MITCWHRWSKNEEGHWGWDFNHISDGFTPGQRHPVGRFPHQTRNWAGAEWLAQPARLIDGVVHMMLKLDKDAILAIADNVSPKLRQTVDDDMLLIVFAGTLMLCEHRLQESSDEEEEI